MRRIAETALGVLAVLLAGAAFAASGGGAPAMRHAAAATDSCSILPQPVSAALAREPEWSLLRLNNLDTDDLGLWNANRPDSCPGLAVARLGVGSGPSYAVALLRVTRRGNEEKVILLIPTDDQIQQRLLVKPHPISIPAVVWCAKPGKTRAWDAGPTIMVAHDSIIVETLEATATQFFFVRGRMRTVVTSD